MTYIDDEIKALEMTIDGKKIESAAIVPQNDKTISAILIITDKHEYLIQSKCSSEEDARNTSKELLENCGRAIADKVAIKIDFEKGKWE